MKKITMRRRMLSLTLAASVALPQVSSAFATSLWNEDGENDHISQVIETSQAGTQESDMPWVTLPTDDKTDQQTAPSTQPTQGTPEETPVGTEEADGPTATQGGETTSTPAPAETGAEDPPAASFTPEPTPTAEPSVAPEPAPTAGPIDTPAPVSTPEPMPTPVPTPVETDPAEGMTTPVPTSEVTPIPTPEDTPDQGGTVPSNGEENMGQATTETPAPEEVGNDLERAEETSPADVDTLFRGNSLFSTSNDLSLSQWMRYRLGYGVDLDTYYGPDALGGEINGRFRVERAGNETYGYRDHTGDFDLTVQSKNTDPNLKYMSEHLFPGDPSTLESLESDYDRYSFLVFPSSETLGRIPDQQFEGWYVYPSGAKAGQSASDAAKWSYGDLEQSSVAGGMIKIEEDEIFPYESGDPGYKVYNFYGETWDGGHDYGYGYEVVRENGVIQLEDPYGDGYPIPAIGDGSKFGGNDPVSIVGHWEPSDESRASEIKLKADVDGDGVEQDLELYPSNISGRPFNEPVPVFDKDKHEYWLRVPADVDSVSLDLSTIELYYNDYVGNEDNYDSYTLDTAKSHVQISASFGGSSVDYTTALSAKMLPAWGSGYQKPKNSVTDPAHSEWKVSGIALSHATNGSPYNDITVKVTSPSGDETTTYVFHVQRLSEPTLTQAWGNTPMGMIRRDGATGGALNTKEKIDIAVSHFEENRRFDAERNAYPSGSANQDGTIFRDTYSANAWPETNDVDMDPNAIIVYQDTSFQDPGISLTNSEGGPVDITTGGNVSRSLKLKQVSALDPTQIGTTVEEDCWYKNGALLSKDDPELLENEAFSQDLTFEQISEQNGTDRIDLSGKNILPGIYTIEYRYTDPVSGKTYGSDEDDYVTDAGKRAASAFRRTLVVLPTPGDVDMDGAVTMADALALQSILGTNAGYTTINGAIIRTDETKANDVQSNDLASLFAYRVCDIDHDGKVDSHDVEELRTLPNPKAINEMNRSNSDHYYIALPPGEIDERYDREDLEVTTTETAKIEMTFLGKEKGTFHEEGYFDAPTGPWASDTTAGIEIGDVFWLGVKVSNTDDLDLESVKSFTFTLTYDASYVTPVVVLDHENWDGVVTGTESEEEQAQKRWAGMMRLYNLSGASVDHTVWGDGWTQSAGSSYGFTEAAGPELKATTHYSTAKIPLEDQQGQLENITFSVELQSGRDPVTLQNGKEYLFAVPFQMVHHPFGQETARLAEYEAGMRGFTLVGTGGTTYAYSCQDKIFGDTTQNLAAILPYGDLGAEIPLGEDRTEVYQIYNYRHAGGDDPSSTVNAVYASPFLSRGGRSASGEMLSFTLNAELIGELPPGLNFHSGAAYIDGIPEKAGTYEFYIGRIPYRMVVEKADLEFWADNKSSYYGQNEFRGAAYDGFTFRYDTSDICVFERERAEDSGGTIRVDGDGSGLAALLADEFYNKQSSQPQFTAMAEGTTPVTNATSVGTYPIRNTWEPQSTNYNFVYTPERAGGSMGLTILPRPVQVVHLNGTEDKKAVVGEVFNDQLGSLGNLKAWRGGSASEGQITFTVRLATTTTDEPGYYNGLPLTPDTVHYTDGVILSGDSLEITYSADYIRNQGDIDRFGTSSSFFYLGSHEEEFRDVRIRDIQLTGGDGMENYRLVSGRADEDVVTEAVVGRVLLRRIKSLEISQLPPLEYHYGDRFTQSNELWYYIKKDGDVTEGQYSYSDRTVDELGITVYWATADEKYDYEHDLDHDYDTDDKYLYETYTGQIFTTDYDGRYLCMSAPSVDDDGNEIVLRRYADKPLVVQKRDIVLTATPTRRYYGEDHQTELTFTYDPAQLAAVDREKRPGLTGAGKELETVLADDGYVLPKLEAVTQPMAPGEVTNANRLTQTTKYTGSENSVIIYGAKSKNYRFLYQYTDDKGVTTTQESHGASSYRIERRPIVVEEIATAEPLSEIYADTFRIYTDDLKLKRDDVKLSLPEHTGSNTTYYLPRSNSSAPHVENIGFSVTDPVVNNDKISFTYTATVIPTDGDAYVRRVDFSRGYFDMTGVTSYREYPVQVSNLRLAGEDANNYTLVYKAPDRGALEAPNQIIPVSNAIDPEINAGHTYYAAGVSDGAEGYQKAMGRVWLRPIETIEIISAGRSHYTYGESYDPSQGDRNVPGSNGMTIHIKYLNDEKNNYEGNVYEGTVSFRMAGVQDGNEVTTFDNRSLKIYYVRPGQTVTDVVNNNAGTQVLDQQSALFVTEHNGARLVVVGQRGGQTEPVVSTLTTSTLQIEPKTLTLRADDQHRVYGENDPTQLGSTFRAGDLASWDRAALGVTNEAERLSADRLGDERLGLNYRAPEFETGTTPRSDVRNGGQAGYEITAKTGGSLDNYTFQYEPGTLYIYPRPVIITGFTSSWEDPIYTIFSDVTARRFWANVNDERFGLRLRPGGYSLPDGTSLPVTGDPLCVGDDMLLRIRVDFPNNLELDSSEAQAPIQVTVEDALIEAGTRAASNYTLVTERDQVSGNVVAVIQNKNAIGKVELRNITSIDIVHEPDDLHYTYGEPLDLTGLQVRINFSMSAGSSSAQKNQVVTYMGRYQFEEQGLYVNYYDAPTWNQDDDPEKIKDDFRVAATGDHVTIAPTHDSQLEGRRNWFSADGKYLVITAQRHKDQAVSQPAIVQTPITVDPLPITFTLDAEDKIYNGDTQAAGTITFTNIFDRSGMVDSMNTSGVTDLVYPVIGATYESDWTSYNRENAFRSFNSYVAQNGYSFTTGTYEANDPSILTENKTLEWTPGYQYGAAGTLAFSYLDPNVAYAQETSHDYYGALTTKEVQITGLRLGGPDAANYILVGQKAGETVEVTTNNVTFARSNGYLGSGLPTATIHKANRAAITETLLPQVEIDPHTNVVRVNYDQSLTAIEGQEEDIHLDELHFEFALQKVVTEGGAVEEPQPDPEEPGEGSGEAAEEGIEAQADGSAFTVTEIVQWAGQNGEDAWDDVRYFGGEAAPKTDMLVTSEDPEAGEYVPREEDLSGGDSGSEGTTPKGQVYQWSALDDGFVLDPSAYPGGVIWPGYELYTTDRTALERGEIYLAVVRAAETNNFNASPAISSVEGYTAELIQAILEAQQAIEAASTSEAWEQAQQDLDAAMQAAAEPLERAVLEAQADAQAELDALMGAGEEDIQLEERPVRSPASAVKTYEQVIETVSLKELQSEGAESDAEPYQVPTLEAIWFTDVEEIPNKDVLDAVVWNKDPTRYRTYAWDRGFTAELSFGQDAEPIFLKDSFEVTVTDRREDGGEETESTIVVNQDHNARLYVDTTFPSGTQSIKVERIVLRPGSIMAALGDAPVALGVTLYPARARAATILWTSSDPTVATVDRQGRITFLGVGTAVITATVPGNYPGAAPQCSASITVTVVEDWKEAYPGSIFDFGNMDAFLVSETEEGEKIFMPEAYITRGEVAKLLAGFYVENPTWTKTGPTGYVDMSGEEEYADEVKLLSSVGVFMGYPDGEFIGEQNISRAEFVTLLARMTGIDIEDTTGQDHVFRDTGEEDTWAYSEIDALSRQTGILWGVGDGYFDPGRSITRSEVAALLTRLLKFPMTENGELVIPSDVTEDHWARENILRAVNGSQILEESMLEETP